MYRLDTSILTQFWLHSSHKLPTFVWKDTGTASRRAPNTLLWASVESQRKSTLRLLSHQPWKQPRPWIHSLLCFTFFFLVLSRVQLWNQLKTQKYQFPRLSEKQRRSNSLSVCDSCHPENKTSSSCVPAQCGWEEVLYNTVCALLARINRYILYSATDDGRTVNVRSVTLVLNAAAVEFINLEKQALQIAHQMLI